MYIISYDSGKYIYTKQQCNKMIHTIDELKEKIKKFYNPPELWISWYNIYIIINNGSKQSAFTIQKWTNFMKQKFFDEIFNKKFDYDYIAEWDYIREYNLTNESEIDKNYIKSQLKYSLFQQKYSRIIFCWNRLCQILKNILFLCRLYRQR